MSAFPVYPPSPARARVYVLYEGFARSHYATYVSASNTSTTLTTYTLPLSDPYYGIGGIYIPKTALGLTKLYAIVNYYMFTASGGVSRLKATIGTNSVTIEEVVSPPSASISRDSRFVDLSSILADGVLYIQADLAGDGTNASSAYLSHTIIFGVSE